MRVTRWTVFLLLPVLFLACGAPGEDWPRFRGPNGGGVSASPAPPLEFGPDTNRLWVADVPFGRSSPVLAGDRIFLSATDGGKFVTMALDRATGETVWRSEIEPAREDEFHRDTDSATTTPVTDGSNVYVFFQEVGLVAYDAKGKQRWVHEMGPFRNFYSIAASPLLAGDAVVMVCDQAQGSFIEAVGKKDGKTRWRVERSGRSESYSSPLLYPATGEPSAIVAYGSGWIDAYDIDTGKTLWSIPRVGVGAVSSPVIVDDVIYVVSPNHGENGWPEFAGVLESFDKDGDGELSREDVAGEWPEGHYGWLDNDGNDSISQEDWDTLAALMNTEYWGAYAIRLPDGEREAAVLWNYRKNTSEIASPLVYDGVYYMVEKGIVTSLDAATGELLKRDRLGGGSPKTYASPVAAAGTIYFGTLDGEVYVVKAGGEWEIASTVELDDEIWATPALADDTLYVRTRGKLYAFAGGGSEG